MDEGGRGMPTVLVGLLWAASLTCCFNLEPQSAQIYNYPDTSSPEREPYFGYAVALQHDDKQDSSWVIVGAPRANSSYHDKSVIIEPGALFKCSLTSETCDELLVDQTGNDKYDSGRQTFHYHDLKNYGWLGGSLDSQLKYQSNRQATCVCAPQWKDQLWTINRHMNGACYIAYDALSNDTNFKKEVPLVNRKKQQRGDFEIYAYGQAGFSVHFPDDSTKLIIGLPGVNRWEGSVLLFEDEKEETTIPTRKKRQAENRNQMFLYDTEVAQSDEFDDSVLFGYSVTSGNFMDPNETHYAAGAPRAGNSFGKVMIFEFPSYEGSELVTKGMLEGDQIGEYFGAALAAADINGDGLDDLIVSSPMYSGNNLENPDRGRIQSFLSTQGNFVHRKSHHGTEVTGARFGTSVASPGDLNHDGFEDIVVGAPFEGTGAVYIFLGSQSGLKDRWSQRLSPENFTPFLKGFGMSVSRGVDIDNNGYSDLAIGSFLSGHAVVVKSRPVAKLLGKVIPSPSSVQWEKNTTINVKTCLHYTGHSVPQNLSVRAKFILDYGNTMFRAVFDDKQSTHSFLEQLVIDNDKCRDHRVTVKEDKINPDFPISLRLEYELEEDSALELTKRPVTDPAARNYTMNSVFIVKDCNGKICRVNMKTTAEFINGIKDVVVIGKMNKLRVTVSNSGEAAYLPNMTLSADRYFILTPPVSHDCDISTNDTKVLLQCQLSNPIKNNSSPDVLEVAVKVNESQLMESISQLELDVNVLGEGEEVESDDNFIPMKLKLATEANLELHGASEEEQVPYKLSDNKKSIITKNVKFNHTYVLIKKGPTPLHLIDLILDIPVNFTYGLNFVKVYGWKEKYSDPYTFNCELIGIKKAIRSSSNNSSMSYGGDVAVTTGNSDIHAANSEKESDGGVQYFNCSSNLIKCARLYCPIHDWVLNTQSAKVSVELDVDLSVLAKHISVKDGTVFSSMAHATIQSLKPQVVHFGNKTITGVVVTYIQPDTLLSVGVPWWMILLAVLGSLLLLGLVGYLLYKKGFFKRTEREEMKAQRARVESSSQGGTVNTAEIED
uniref:Uncharacterized protein n=2 Tax=Scylla olivacea TaxID=85551 RepID=A0A0P4W2E3_SCYOL